MLRLISMRFFPMAVAPLIVSAALLAQPARRAPSFSLPDVNNQQHDLADYRGKVVVVEIMRTDCPNCKPFAKKLEELKTLYGGQLVILAITNPPDAPANVMKFLNEFKVTYPILFDCGQVAFSYVRPSPLKPSINIPHVYLLDRSGYIREDFEFGPNTAELFLGNGLRPEIDKLITAAPAKPAAVRRKKQ